jgi:glycosyltransferase A (GT-A) superfamily protein (DUF2064 family)
MGNTVAICFAKTPGFTPAKTRLARDIGVEKCERLYHLMVQRGRELMDQIQPIATPYVAVNEASAEAREFWQDSLTYTQVPGGLGDKLAHAEEFFFRHFEQIIFWGTDSVALRLEHFETVQEKLHSFGSVVIPALDGGFALYASSRKLLPGHWQSIHYSTSSTADELIARLGRDTAVTPAISDLDTLADLPVVLAEMSAHPSQGKAWDQLKSFLATF